MEQTETQNNTVIINTDVPEQDTIIEGNKKNLPKFTLPRGERLHISLEQIDELHGRFFNSLTELREGTAHATPELKSIMESVISLSYFEEIYKLRSANYTESVIEEERQEALNSYLTPRTWRKFFRRRRNESQVMLDELVRRQVKLFIERKASELPTVESETEETELLPFEVVIDNLFCVLPRMRKKRRAEVTGLIEQISDVYNGKADECKRLASELEIARKQVSEAENKARAAEEMLEEFLKDSTPAPEDTETAEAKAEEEQKTPEEAEQTEAEPETEDGEEREEEQTEEEADSETADEDDEESLSYDGLEGMDEQE